MLIRDLMVDGKGLFHYMNELETLPFIPAMDVETMDKMFIGLHGMKTVSPSVASVMLNGGVNEDNMKNVATMLLIMYGMSWNRLYELYTQDIELETYSMVTTENYAGTETSSSSTSSESASEDLDKVSGFNSQDMVEDSIKNVDRQDTMESEGSRSDERTITKEVKGLQGSRVAEMERLIRFVKKNLIFDVVFENVANFVGMSFYDIKFN